MKKLISLHFRIARTKGEQFEIEEVKVPLSEKTLADLKAETNRFRKRIIPVVSEI